MLNWHMVTGLVLSVLVVAGAGRPFTDNAFYAGGAVALHERHAEIELHGSKTIAAARKPLVGYELVFGRNVALSKGIRLSFPLLLEYGEVKERTLENSRVWVPGKDTTYLIRTDVDLYTVVFVAGIHPRLEFPLRLTKNTRLIPGVGAGVQVLAFREEGRNLVEVDGRKKKILLTPETDPFLEHGHYWSASGYAGCGLEVQLLSSLYCTILYNSMLWKPIVRNTASDLYIIKPQPYSELFFTHTLQFTVSLLI